MPRGSSLTLPQSTVLGLFFIQRYRFLTIDQFARAAGLNRSTASDQLRFLERFHCLEHFGNTGLFTVAAISGLTDMDAITLSTSNLVKSGNLDASTGWRVILVGGAANLVFKGILAAILGTGQLGRLVAAGFGVSLVGALLIAWLWPA